MANNYSLGLDYFKLPQETQALIDEIAEEWQVEPVALFELYIKEVEQEMEQALFDLAYVKNDDLKNYPDE